MKRLKSSGKTASFGVFLFHILEIRFIFTKGCPESGLTHFPHTFRLQRIDLKEMECFSLQRYEYSQFHPGVKDMKTAPLVSAATHLL